MSALTTAAIIGLAAASAGSAVASSAIQSHAAGNAVDAQTAASNKALGVQQQNYQQAQQMAAPYQQAGMTALGHLNSMPMNNTPFNPNNYRGGAPVPQPPMGAQPPQMGLGPQQPLNQAPPMAGMPVQSETVTIQTPDGRTLSGFPRAQLQQALQRGAKVVG